MDPRKGVPDIELLSMQSNLRATMVRLSDTMRHIWSLWERVPVTESIFGPIRLHSMKPGRKGAERGEKSDEEEEEKGSRNACVFKFDRP